MDVPNPSEAEAVFRGRYVPCVQCEERGPAMFARPGALWMLAIVLAVLPQGSAVGDGNELENVDLLAVLPPAD